MGGNLLKGRRISREEYDLLSKEIIKLLSDFQLYLPHSVFEKDSFGDIDILLKDSNRTFACQRKLVSLGYEIESTGNTFSFLYKGVQIDILPCDKDTFDYFFNYYSWNDLGGLIGTLTKRLKLSSGFLGLYYKHYEQNNYIGSILVSLNYEDTLKLLKLDCDKYNQGFNNYEEMFEWLYESPYFDSKAFDLSSLNNKNRARNQKRKVYMLFLDWLQSKKLKNSFTDIKDIDGTLLLLKDTIPRFKHQYKVLKLEVIELSQYKDKFNGKIVKDLTGLTGLELSTFMKDFRDTYLRQIISFMSPEDVQESIKSYYEDVFKEA